MSESERRPKREAKIVQHFAPEEIKEKAELVVGDGAGTKLGEIENVKIKIDKLNAGSDELKALHRLCFGRPGEKSKIKATLRMFSGFTGGDAEVTKKKETASKLDSKTLKSLLTTCDQPTTGTKVGDPPSPHAMRTRFARTSAGLHAVPPHRLEKPVAHHARPSHRHACGLHPPPAEQADNVDSLVSFLTEPAESGKKSLAVKAGEKRARAAAKKVRVDVESV